MKKTLATLAILTTLAYPANTTCEQGDNVTNFVKRFYDVILHREPDTEGLAYWEQKLASQTLSASELANGFIFSPEFTGQENDDVDYVNVLYRAFFNREPDTEGFNGWIENLASGMSREEVLHGFLYSQEFKNLANSYCIKANENSVDMNITNFVKRFYDVILHREPDTEGLAYWEQKLASQTLSASELANGFIFSPEFTGQENDDVDYVNVLYRAFFNREPDTEGFNGWIENLASGMSREEVLHGFLYSQEFKNLADAYGIRASNTSGGGGTEDGSLPVIDNLPPVDPPSSNGDIDMSGAGGPTHL